MKKFTEFLKSVWNGTFEYPEDMYENSPFWDKVKSIMCADTKFSNIFYLLWGDLNCPCCAFFRGLILGGTLTAIGAYIVS